MAEKRRSKNGVAGVAETIEDPVEPNSPAARTTPVSENNSSVLFDCNSNSESDPDSEESHSEFCDPPPKSIGKMDSTRPESFDAGCDSDGNAVPRDMTLSEEQTLEDEEPLGETKPDHVETMLDDDGAEESDPPNEPVDTSEEMLKSKSLTVKVIKEELAIRNVTCPSRFKRQELIDCLRKSLHLPVVTRRSDINKPKKGKRTNDKKDKKDKKDNISDFAPGAHWKVLKPSVKTVEEPTNPSFEKPRLPTESEAFAGKPHKLQSTTAAFRNVRKRRVQGNKREA